MTVLQMPIMTDDMRAEEQADEKGEAQDLRDYYRNFDVPNQKNIEAVAKAELAAVVFQVKRYLHVKGVSEAYVDEVVAAATKATIETARRMSRERTLAKYEATCRKYGV